jgi:ethanolaminephosphotransferase
MAVYRVCKEKKKSFGTALWQLSPLVIYCVAGYAWLSGPGSVVLRKHLILFIITLGIVFGRMAVRSEYACYER